MHTIMLIDDDPTMLRLLKTLIEIEGYKTEAWSGNSNIIPELSSKKPDAILLDVNLRGISGIDLLKSIRSDANFGLVPILMTSGMDYTEECMQAGATEFLLKPYMPDVLIEKLRSHLGRMESDGA